MNIGTNKIFISAYKGTDSSVNERNTDKLCSMLKRENVSYRLVKGAWKGVPEESVCIYTTDIREHHANVDLAFKLGLLFQQEAFLEVTNENNAILHGIADGITDIVGVFKQVDKDEALQRDGYTHSEGVYYIVDKV